MATVIAQPKPRPIRSNSLQRMLELEKQCMLERMNARGVPATSPGSNGSSSRSTSPKYANPIIQVRRRESLKRRDHRKNVKNSLRSSTGAPQLPKLAPLVIDFNTDMTATANFTTTTAPKKEQQAPARVEEPVKPPVLAAEPDKPSPKVVAFQFPPSVAERKSLCRSPTWESYGQRKMEKEKEKEKENIKKVEVKAQAPPAKLAKPKKRRLSKPPPSANSLRFPPNQPYSETRPSDNAGSSSIQPKGRPASFLGVFDSGLEPPPDRHTRRRSGSFSSLIESLGIRRASVDAPRPDPGFIGGIKLEQERHAIQQTMSSFHNNFSDSDIHPALRKSTSNINATWSHSTPTVSPLRFETPESPKKAYPPIAMQTTSSKTRSLLPPAAQANSDLSTIDKWRARVGFKSHKRDSSVGARDALRIAEDRPRISAPLTTMATMSDTALNHMGPPARNNPYTHQHSSSSSSAPVDGSNKELLLSPTHSPTTSQEQGRTSHPQERKDHTTSQSRHRATGQSETTERRRGRSKTRKASGTTDKPNEPKLRPRKQNTAPESPPPTPPRRSSKRNSVLGLNWTPPTPQSDMAELASGVDQGPSKHTLFNGQPSPPLSDVDQGEASKPPPVHSSHGLSDDDLVVYPGESNLLDRPPSRASATSSNYFQCPSLHSSADTSQPRSSLANTPMLATAESFQCLVEPPWDELGETLSDPDAYTERTTTKAMLDEEATVRPLQQTRTQDFDPINEAARKVMAAFPEMPIRSRIERPPMKKGKAEATSSSVLDNRISHHSGLRNNLVALPSPYREVGIQQDGKRPSSAVKAENGEPIGKIFVECCGCRYYHDMPSNLYQAMANPEGLVTPGKHNMEFAGALSMTVRCPWCKHEMSTRCCAGFAAVVYVKERLH